MPSIQSMNPGLCPEPHKKKFDTKREAEDRLAEILSRREADEEYRLSHDEKDAVPCRAYFCVDGCGYYHLTARPRREDDTPIREPWPDFMRPRSNR